MKHNINTEKHKEHLKVQTLDSCNTACGGISAIYLAELKKQQLPLFYQCWISKKREPYEEEGVSQPVKPGSVVDNHSSRTYVTVRLKQPTRPQRGPRQRGPIWSCSEWSLPCHELLPAARCALTAPFHPYLIPCLRKGHRRFALCCTSRRLAPPRRYLALCPMEPGLSSPCLRRQRLSGPTHGAHYTLLPLCCKVVVSVASSGQITAIVQLPF